MRPQPRACTYLCARSMTAFMSRTAHAKRRRFVANRIVGRMHAVIERRIPCAERVRRVVIEHRHQDDVIAPNRRLGLQHHVPQHLAIVAVHVLANGSGGGLGYQVDLARIFEDQPIAWTQVALANVPLDFTGGAIDGLG